MCRIGRGHDFIGHDAGVVALLLGVVVGVLGCSTGGESLSDAGMVCFFYSNAR